RTVPSTSTPTPRASVGTPAAAAASAGSSRSSRGTRRRRSTRTPAAWTGWPRSSTPPSARASARRADTPTASGRAGGARDRSRERPWRAAGAGSAAAGRRGGRGHVGVPVAVGGLHVPLPVRAAGAGEPGLRLLRVAAERVVDAGRLEPGLPQPSLGGDDLVRRGDLDTEVVDRAGLTALEENELER